ncbi:MAG: hypothetical protein SFU91_15085 [Chloroherpetonaceae bacterium]|nr:hypothetical protein [Chloroherpetonaceae bacterium]
MTCTPRQLEKIEELRCKNPLSETQPFPTKGKLKANMNLSLRDLKQRLKQSGGKEVRAYILKTFDWKGETLIQYGSGPNFQGGLITLSTCKHHMRTYYSSTDWVGNWVLGKMKKSVGENALFYLMKVAHAYDSQYDYWQSLDENVKKAKNSRYNILGDAFEPKRDVLSGNARYTPNNYYKPHTKHSHYNGWENDIEYKSRTRYTSILVGDVNNSFLWTSPKIYFHSNKNNTRGDNKCSMDEFIDCLFNTPL